MIFLIDVRESNKLYEIISKIKPNFLVHFAASAYVQESFINPLDYISNNIGGMESVTEFVQNFQSLLYFHLLAQLWRSKKFACK